MLPYFPFERDEYALTMNARLLPLDRLIEIDPPHYRRQVAERVALLADDHRYYCQMPPDTIAAGWEALELLLPNMARHYPDHFTLDRAGAAWHWTNRLLGTTITFTPGDDRALPLAPLDWLGRQVQEDLLIMDPTVPGTPLVAGQLCFAADWCLDDKRGLSFLAIHDPVPGFSDGRVGRSADLLMQRTRANAPTGRIGWAFTADGTLNHAPRLAAALAGRGGDGRCRQRRGAVLSPPGTPDLLAPPAHRRAPLHHPHLRRAARCGARRGAGAGGASRQRPADDAGGDDPLQGDGPLRRAPPHLSGGAGAAGDRGALTQRGRGGSIRRAPPCRALSHARSGCPPPAPAPRRRSPARSRGRSSS